MNRYLSILKAIVVLLFISNTMYAQNADPHQNIGSEITGLPLEKTLLILDISVHDSIQYKQYQSHLEPIIKKFGGTYLVHSSGIGLENEPKRQIIPAEGNWNPNHLIVLQWNSMEALQNFLSSEAYRKIDPLRNNSTTIRSLIVSEYKN